MYDAGQPEDFLDESRGDHLSRWPLRDDPAVAHGHQVGCEACGLVEVVEHRHQAAAPAVEVDHQFHQLYLVADVEKGGGLVQQQDGGVLGERHGDPYALPLAARQLIDPPGGQAGDARVPHGAGNQLLVAPGPSPGESLVREPAPGHQLGDGDAVGGDRALRQDADLPGDLPGGACLNVAAVEDHLPGGWPDEPGQGFQQRGLAAAVRAHHRGELPVEDLQVEAGGDDVAAVAELDPRRLQPAVSCHAVRLPSCSRR